ncbi:lysozyme [Streptomyces ureilyticus]|uniref:Lysozyme n=1 Tax=Streptomyces ureilyticus TaxID=1775131 RepID=A0ABX0DME2_9ACTN|nr:lysozyme [Streptomyces ureilyticus]NGO43048.1 lysozyme [Streptomyces ureilyticus]
MTKNRFALTESRSPLDWSRPMAAADRALVVLIENGGIDLGIPEVVDLLLSAVPGSGLIPDAARRELAEYLRAKIKQTTDVLLESAELAANRYSDAQPGLYGEVTVLRDGTASYQELKSTLISLTQRSRIIDVYILTHGDINYISVPGGIDSDKIRAIRAEAGRPLSIRTVYMMNCEAQTLNQAWLDAGAKAASGSLGLNVLPEPTMYFFWRSWRDGQPFETAATSAYRRTVNLINQTVRAFVAALPIPGSASLADQIDTESLDAVRSSAPVIQGQRTVTITSDDLSFTRSISSGLATTVLPISSLPPATSGTTVGDQGLLRHVSAEGLDFIRGWEAPALVSEGFDQALRDRVELALQAVGRVSVPLDQNQVDALVSFVCGIGAGPFERSTLLVRLNDGDHQAVVTEMSKWTKTRRDGQIIEMEDLVRRRQAEAEFYLRAAGSTPAPATAATQQTYKFVSPSRMVHGQSVFSYQQNPLVIAGIGVADAAQIGLDAVAVGQAQLSASAGSFTLTYPQVQRMLTNEARQQMPGAQTARSVYTRTVLQLDVGRIGTANADVEIEWGGNPHGEIDTPVIRRNLHTSSDWSRSSAVINIVKRDKIPLPNTDPRAWPIVFTYDGTYDPMGNGHWEFNGEFEINAFGAIKFNLHDVVSRSLADWAIAGTPADYVAIGPTVEVPTPVIPDEQSAYLRSRLP